MKPFDLQKALAGAPVVTRSGIKVKRVVHIPEITESEYRVIAVFEDGNFTFTNKDGFYIEDGSFDENDLLMESVVVEKWAVSFIHEYDDTRGLLQKLFPTLEAAEDRIKLAPLQRRAQIHKIMVEE